MNSNYDFRTLHEGFLKDIFDIATDIKNSDEFDIVSKLKDLGPLAAKQNTNFEFNKGISQNIAKAAKGLTATFPVIVTEATPLDQAVMISKAVERKCCAMLQMLFAAHQITCAKDAHTYISTFHNNLSNDHDISDYNVDDIIENMGDLNLKESYEYKYLVEECIKEVQDDCKNNIHYHLGESINPESLNKYMIKKVFNEVQISGINRTIDSTTTDDIYGTDPETGRPVRTGSITTRSQLGSRIDVDDIKKSYDMLANTIVRTDVQKANEATPSLLIVNFTSQTESEKCTTPAIITTCVIGVKCIIHYVKSADMVNKLVLKSGDKRGLFNLIRATTREISFFKDFLFSVDRAKIDALSKVGKGSTSSLWKMLELRAHNATYNKAKNKMDASCSAIATIVISRDEAEIIKKEHRIDITKPGTLLSIMRGYSFMAAALVDQNAEKVDFLWDDGDKNFETLSFMSLEREENGGMYKKVINMMSKGR